MMNEMNACPCGSGQDYSACCGRFIDGGMVPDTAEQLMRSRYSAFTLAREAYLQATWHASTRPADLGVAVTDAVHWLGLEIKRTQRGGANDSEGTVEFVARYKRDGKATRLHEVSHFVREAGRWFYVDGVFPDTRK